MSPDSMQWNGFQSFLVTYQGFPGYRAANGFARMTPAQLRAARALLDWRQEQVAEAAGIGVTSVRQLEAGNVKPHKSTLRVLQWAFEQAGVEFIPGGVKFRDVK